MAVFFPTYVSNVRKQLESYGFVLLQCNCKMTLQEKIKLIVTLKENINQHYVEKVPHQSKKVRWFHYRVSGRLVEAVHLADHELCGFQIILFKRQHNRTLMGRTKREKQQHCINLGCDENCHVAALT